MQGVVALIAYESPEKSPLAHLLLLSQREHVADVLNAAVLQVSATAAKGSAAGSDGGAVSSCSAAYLVRSAP